MEDNKYLTKVCALLRPFPSEAKKTTSKGKTNKYTAKITLAKKLKSRLGEGTHRQQKVK